MRVLIVEARFYPEISDELFEGAVAALKAANVSSERIERSEEHTSELQSH